MTEQLTIEELNGVVLGIIEALAAILSPQVMKIISERANAAIEDRSTDDTPS
ncbi:MAG: hypothetical protein ACO3O7_05745 [Ilumatobacteraceae bacterium]